MTSVQYLTLLNRMTMVQIWFSGPNDYSQNSPNLDFQVRMTSVRYLTFQVLVPMVQIQLFMSE
jgi:hypothetical protein